MLALWYICLAAWGCSQIPVFGRHSIPDTDGGVTNNTASAPSHLVQTKREHRQAEALLNLKNSDILAPHALPVRYFIRILVTCTTMTENCILRVYSQVQ
ncbi:hypothetical protein MGG_14734 [Pyricularia oryzae 70-15]|uniref:Secreted protein n=1 Tax=Pyricularia oryzae (strain 70-15 / ATCC MYA-4617 / FGSC 8958) TaxID=242507 RepID=G4MYX7_PYRO7|nr:uncharacterized protein MGG_14734 [Pyricularia oryzae 70-15]EHA53638.1 hypothetical protein MGG_14734 [Pyricularia oryzae 70-15]